MFREITFFYPPISLLFESYPLCRLQLSLVTLAAATSAQLTFPWSPAGSNLVYASGFGYNTYGLNTYGLRNEGAPPNNPFEPRTAADVFRPEAVPTLG